MDGIQEWTVEAPNPRSLCWQDDALIDWVAGGNLYYLDGTTKPRHVAYSYRFDAAVVSPSGTFAVIYEKRGTKGLVLKNGTILREINRSFYHAHVYEYPVALFRRSNGQEVMAHCPEMYCRIDIDDLETGKRLTDLPDRKPIDIFHSRFATSSAATFLLSAGWVWQPWDIAVLYDIEAALNDPHLLDSYGLGPMPSVEVSSAAFQDDEKLILASSVEEYDDDDKDHTQLLSNSVAIYDIGEKRFLSQVTPDAPVGTIMPVESHLVIGYYEHPKLIDLRTGKTLHSWPDLNSGKQTSSIIWGIEQVPPLALDPAHSRFAVADESAIHVVQINAAQFL